MKKLSPYIELKKEIDPYAGKYWVAYWSGTRNRVKRANGLLVYPRIYISDLRFDLLNNPMEHGVTA